MDVMERELSGLVGLVGDQPATPERAEDVPPDLYTGDEEREDVLVGLGGTGRTTTLYTRGFLSRDGRDIGVLLFDNAYNDLQLGLQTMDGQRIDVSPFHFVRLGFRRSRDLVHHYPILAERYLDRPGRAGLLHGLAAGQHYTSVVHGGGHAFRPVSALDIDLSITRIRHQVRRLLRRYQPHRYQPRRSFNARDSRVVRDSVPLMRLRVWVVFGTSGSCGAAGSYLIPYIILDEADRMGLTREGDQGLDVSILGVGIGPTIFTGLHDHVIENDAATKLDLQASFDHGIRWPLIDGTTLEFGGPAFDRVFLMDDPEATERIELDSGSAGLPDSGARPQVPEAARHDLYKRVALSLYLAITGNAISQFETDVANPADGIGRQLWGRMASSLVDLQGDVMREYVALQMASKRLELAGVAPGKGGAG